MDNQYPQSYHNEVLNQSSIITAEGDKGETLEFITFVYVDMFAAIKGDVTMAQARRNLLSSCIYNGHVLV